MLFKILRIDEWQAGNTLTAICRVELFERLGMAHTCYRAWNGHGPAERHRLREEDSHLNDHLSLLMAEYKHTRKLAAATSWEFWDSWWRVVDMILPPLKVLTRFTRFEADQARAERERKALVDYGYDSTLDFLEVIRLHFEKYRRGLAHGEWPDDDGEDGWSTDDDLDTGELTDCHTRRSLWVDEMRDGGWVYTDITAIAASFDGKKKQENVTRAFNRWRGKCKRVVGYRMILVSRRKRRRVRFGRK